MANSLHSLCKSPGRLCSQSRPEIYLAPGMPSPKVHKSEIRVNSVKVIVKWLASVFFSILPDWTPDLARVTRTQLDLRKPTEIPFSDSAEFQLTVRRMSGGFNESDSFKDLAAIKNNDHSINCE